MAAQLINQRERLMKPQLSKTLILTLHFVSKQIGTKNFSSEYLFLALHISLYDVGFFLIWLIIYIRQIDRDCEFLESERIMDYSLLIGLHFRDDSTGDKMGLSPFLLRTGNYQYHHKHYHS